MAEPSGTLNIRLINSLIEVILSLSEEEQALLEQKIQQIRQPSITKVDQFFQDLEEMEPDPTQPSLQEISEVVREARHQLWSN